MVKKTLLAIGVGCFLSPLFAGITEVTTSFPFAKGSRGSKAPTHVEAPDEGTLGALIEKVYVAGCKERCEAERIAAYIGTRYCTQKEHTIIEQKLLSAECMTREDKLLQDAHDVELTRISTAESMRDHFGKESCDDGASADSR